MKRCKVIALIICSIVVVICTAMIIRINIQFPKAEDKSYTIVILLILTELLLNRLAIRYVQ